MWLWWVLSMLIIVACTAFTSYVIITKRSYSDIHFSIGRYRAKKDFNPERKTNGTGNEESTSFLRTKLQSLEEGLLLYTARLNKINERLQYVEKDEGQKENSINNLKSADKDEDWKELYYEVLDKSEKLENELDATMQSLEIKDRILLDLEKDIALKAEKQSLIQLQLNEAQSLQNKIELLQRELEGAAEREADLEKLLISEITVREKYDLLQHRYNHLQSESDELRIRIVETNETAIILLQKINKIPELESNLEMAEAEKTDLLRRLENLLLKIENFPRHNLS